MPAQKRDDDLALWKNHINCETLADMAAKLGQAYPRFDRAAFLEETVTPSFPKLELKEKIRAVAFALRNYLPQNYSRATKVLIKTAPHLNGFHNWILTAYVEEFGREQFESSIAALEKLTPHGTSEFAIRPFMIEHRKQMMPILHRWATDPNEHVRRLAAEGSRPRGVWVAHIAAFRENPAEVIELLDKMCRDESLYVRKAVANNLNDISRDNPEAALKTARRWLRLKDKNADWVVKRGMRSLIKLGHPGVFPLLGFTAKPKVAIPKIKAVPQRIRMERTLQIEFYVKSLSKKNQKLAIDYRIDYVTKMGKQSPKVFKMSERSIDPGATVPIKLKHTFADNSTRKHYPGRHVVSIQLNGVVHQSLKFDLE
ncbi:MAG: DNA alkylation repair protein [bacterium]|nr:DNA alkylation repair protein [bacterium]